MNRTALLLVFAGSMASSVAFAQQASPPTPSAPEAQSAPAHAANPHKQAMRLAKQLNLSDDQTSKLEPILADRDNQLAAIRGNTSLDPMIASKQVHIVQRTTRERMAAVLTPAQAAQFRAMQQSHGGKTQNQPLTPAPAV